MYTYTVLIYININRFAHHASVEFGPKPLYIFLEYCDPINRWLMGDQVPICIFYLIDEYAEHVDHADLDHHNCWYPQSKVLGVLQPVF